MAGVLLSDSEYRHELQADIEPFEGLLLGFFFISVGMSADLRAAGRRAAGDPGGDRRAAAGDQDRDRLRAGPPRRQRPERRDPLRPGAAAGRRVRLRAVRRGGGSPCHDAEAVAAGDAGGRRCRWWRRRCSSRSTERWLAPRLRAPAGSASSTPSTARRRAGDHRRLRPHGSDRRPHPALARHPPSLRSTTHAEQIDLVRRFGNKAYYGDADPARRAACRRRRRGQDHRRRARDDRRIAQGGGARQAAFPNLPSSRAPATGGTCIC